MLLVNSSVYKLELNCFKFYCGKNKKVFIKKEIRFLRRILIIEGCKTFLESETL